MSTQTLEYHGYRFPPEIISYAVWLYRRFCLSFREVEELLAERGVTVSYESVRQWGLKFGPSFAKKLRHRQGRLGATWHLDEVFVSIQGKRYDLWRTVKSLVRDVQSEAGVLSLDDSIEEKPYTDENDIVCWHYDHSKKRMLKGLNFLTARYSSPGVRVPVGFHVVAKTQKYTDPKTQQEKRRSPVSKNAVGQELINQAVTNRIPFGFVLFEVGFASAETLVFIKQEQHRAFICPLKTHRKVALSQADKPQDRYVRVDTLALEAQTTREIYLAGGDFPLVLVKQVFTNADGSSGLRYLVSSDTTLSFDDLTTTYHKRWQVECYHKSLKQNVSLAKSPTQTVTTQTEAYPRL